MTARFGPPSGLTCPDCGGALWEIEQDRAVRYQCHVGHQYAPESLDAGQRDAIDGALWTAVRVLEEHAALKGRMATRAADRGMKVVAARFAEGAVDARTQAKRLRSILVDPQHAQRASESGAVPRRAAPRRKTTVRRRNARQS